MAAAPRRKQTTRDDEARLISLGYRPQLNRVLGLFANFSVAFTYLSPMVGIYSLFVLGVGTGGPAYVWLTWIPVLGMLFVALVFGELASHYPVAGALYQYSKFSVGPRYGWFVGWFVGGLVGAGPRPDPAAPVRGWDAAARMSASSTAGLAPVIWAAAVDPADVPTIRSAWVTSNPASTRPARTPISHALPADPPPPKTNAVRGMCSETCRAFVPELC